MAHERDELEGSDPDEESPGRARVPGRVGVTAVIPKASTVFPQTFQNRELLKRFLPSMVKPWGEAKRARIT